MKINQISQSAIFSLQHQNNRRLQKILVPTINYTTVLKLHNEKRKQPISHDGNNAFPESLALHIIHHL